ncbi:hypothetical protein KQX54_000208, partial [Cotesia glomerata]
MKQLAYAASYKTLMNCGKTDGFYNVLVQKIYGSNGISNTRSASMTGTKETAKILDPTIAANHVGMGVGSMGVTTLPRSGNWLHPAGLMLGRSVVWVRLYCQE